MAESNYRDLGLANDAITSVTRTSGNGAPGTLDTYTIRTRSNKEFNFTVWNGSNGTNGTDGNSFVIIGEVSNVSGLPDVSGMELGTAYFVGTTNPKDVYVVVNVNGTKQWANEGNLEGPAGQTGPRGVSIASVTPQSTSSAGGGSSVYNVNLEGGTVAGTFTVYNGLNGSNGLPGAPGADGKTPTLTCANGSNIGTYRPAGPTVTPSDDGNNNYTFTFDYLRGEKGEKGDPGDDGTPGEKGDTGATGNGISSITGPTTSGLVDTYTINMTDGTSKQFTVTNAKSITGVARQGQSNLDVTYRITFNSGNPFDYVVTNGNGITGITGPTSSGLEDTYTINTNVGGPYTFTVKNGIMSAAQFGYGNQGVASADFWGEAGIKTINVTISSNYFPMGVRLEDQDGNSVDYICWQRTSATNVQIIMSLGSAVSPDEPFTAYVDYVNLV